MGGKLAPSLRRLFTELDEYRPHRAHVVDGWYADPKHRISYGHNPGHNGYSHAIDVDKNGVDPLWIIRHITKEPGILWYIIWNRTLYSATYSWKPKEYKGVNPHTDHLHIEIRQTDRAEQWHGYWGIAPTGEPLPPKPTGGGGTSTDGNVTVDFGPNYGGRDYRGHFDNLGSTFATAGNTFAARGAILKSLRGQ